ncbi:hypothetical protein CALVIDRAFT_541093 [Calocera viscosa TUFC12733]|uniref:Uncharacterized protein n=1 Tax=Calocera viscosa (strain TUFC12733) TaxID=1330018 RepID=A0A167I3R7_CALVF|nr:hypothetical protein CALVIDRAFT_541093 [Calocera viscosa TUFC12733]
MPEPEHQTTSLPPTHYGSEVTSCNGGTSLFPAVSAPCPITRTYSACPGAARQAPLGAQLDLGPNMLEWSHGMGGVESNWPSDWETAAPPYSWPDAGGSPTAAVVDDNRYCYPNTGCFNFAVNLGEYPTLPEDSKVAETGLPHMLSLHGFCG